MKATVVAPSKFVNHFRNTVELSFSLSTRVACTKLVARLVTIATAKQSN